MKEILYSSSTKPELIGYTNIDWAGETETQKSTSGYVFHIGTSVFSWSSKKQKVVTLSTVDVEYITTINCATQAVWLQIILSELQHHQDGLMKVLCDNKPMIALTKNPVFHGRSKHIDIKHHYIRDLIRDKEIMVEYCTSEDQIADIFTKPLKINLFLKMENLLGMMRPNLREGVR